MNLFGAKQGGTRFLIYDFALVSSQEKPVRIRCNVNTNNRTACGKNPDRLVRHLMLYFTLAEMKKEAVLQKTAPFHIVK